MKAIPYRSIREELQSGDVILVSHDRWRSWYDLQVMAVRLFTMSKWCHVGIIWRDAGRFWVIHAVQAGIQKVPLSKELPCDVIPCHAWDDSVQSWLVPQIGNQDKSYSKWLGIASAFDIAVRKDDAKVHCAELINMSLAKHGIDVGEKAMTPAKVGDALMDLGYPCYRLLENDDGG